jgi:hypothetical protein
MPVSTPYLDGLLELRDFSRNAFCALSEIEQKFDLAHLRLPTNLPISLPSKLVDERREVRAAEANKHAASAQVGVAEPKMEGRSLGAILQGAPLLAETPFANPEPYVAAENGDGHRRTVPACRVGAMARSRCAPLIRASRRNLVIFRAVASFSSRPGDASY